MNKIKMRIYEELPIRTPKPKRQKPRLSRLKRVESIDDDGEEVEQGGNDDVAIVEPTTKAVGAPMSKADLLEATNVAIARACLNQEKDIDGLIDALEKCYPDSP